MDGNHKPFMSDSFRSPCKDSNETISGSSYFTDTALRLSSYCTDPLDMYDSGASKRKWNDGSMCLENEISLALELGSPRSVADGTVLTFGRNSEDYSATDICLDFHLNRGVKRACKELRNSSPSLGNPEKERPKIDLELSLSTVGTESDVTSVTLASSPVPASSDIVQLVDEGSTSSKWKRGPLLPPLSDGLQITEAANSVSKPPRKTAVKTCQFPGCEKGARGASGRCISHGGGRRCQRPGCIKGAEGKTAFCKAHGGGRRCEHLGCTKSAEGRTNFCIAHGGGRRCGFQGGCTRAARGKSGLCIRHGGGKRCRVENCTKSAEGLSGLCIGHGGGRRCQFPECTKGAQGSTKFCKAHGGGKRCTYPGCTKGAEGSTPLCKGHGGGKRCNFQGGGVCTKSVHGGTLFCVSHGGGKRCGVQGCTRSARGRTSFCVRHGGGKRCKFEGCGKSAQGRTDFCKAHGGGKRCLWGHTGSAFGEGDSPCDKFARGKFSLCAAHAAQVHDRRVHGDGTVNLKMKGIEGKDNSAGEETLAVWNRIGFDGHWPREEQFVGQCSGSSATVIVPEGRVHGGSLMAMLRGSDTQLGS